MVVLFYNILEALHWKGGGEQRRGGEEDPQPGLCPLAVQELSGDVQLTA